jgi:outer membrane protein OmpA-like peptidoglycan-associated protein
MPVRPMLGDIELQQVQNIEVDEDRVLVQHHVPALEGDFLQSLGRRSTRVFLTGVLTGTESKVGLETLRKKFHAAEPISFVADITTATKVDQVLIEELKVQDLAGKPERFAYALTLREFIPPPAPKKEELPPPPPPPPSVDTGTLIVEVVVEGQPNFDFSTTTVTVEGTQADGKALSRNLTNRANNIWTEEKMPPGQYTAKAVVAEPKLSGSTAATVRAGEQTKVKIVLHPLSNIAKAFVVHFRFDRAFIEPCLRQVLQQVVDHAQANPNEKLIILGHTDKVGDDLYNQLLSERRARSVFAFLTFGRDRAAAIAEWNELRKPAGPPLRDNWGVREYQFMLQDLGYYFGNIDEVPGTKTNNAVRAFQKDKGLPVTGLMDDATWSALVEAYMAQDAFELPEESFFRNAKDSCNGGILKWLGAGEQDPVKNIQTPWRPNRRTEILFVQADRIPCDVPKPRTFDLPTAGGTWCLGPDLNSKPEAGIKRVCFLSRGKAEDGKLLVQPAEPDKITVSGSITFEDGKPVANAKYVLIAPDGEYLDGEGSSGRPIPKRADANGNFSYPEPKLIGLYILEILDLKDPELARLKQEKPFEARGSIVCQRLDKSPAPPKTEQQLALVGGVGAGPGAGSGVGAVVQPGPVAPPPSTLKITPKSNIIVVKKSYTNPSRVEILLKVDGPLKQDGVLKRIVTPTSGDIQFFETKTGGTAIAFDKVFSSTKLKQGVKIFAEAPRASGNLDDVTLTLELQPGPTTAAPISVKLTAVSLKLDICEPPLIPGFDPDPLPQPLPTPPPAGTGTDKFFGGATLFAGGERSLLIVRRVLPAAFSGNLVLRQVKLTGDKVTGLDNKVAILDNTTEPSIPKNNPHVFNTSTFPPAPGDVQFRVQGVRASTVLRDTGFQLGIEGVEEDGDRVSVTVGVAPLIDLGAPNIPGIPRNFGVLVKKPHTNPARKKVTLKTTAGFNRSGTFTVSSATNAVRFFDRATGGNPVVIPSTGKVFTGSQLTSGVDLFVEGANPSASFDDIGLKLSLQAGGAGSVPVASDATESMTAVELTLDICASRPAPDLAPPPLPQPPVTPPAPGTVANDKWFGGRFLAVQDAGKNQERALLIIGAVKPSFGLLDSAANSLVLRQVEISGDKVTKLDTKVQVFTAEDPKNPGAALGNSIDSVPVGGAQFFVEGSNLSTTRRDTGFQLGLKGVDDDGDRVSITAGTFTLDVKDAQQVGGANSTNFLALLTPTQVVTVIANIAPPPSPTQPVTWSGGQAVAGKPLQRTVSRASITSISPESVAASFAGLTRKADVFIVRVTLDVDADRDGIVSQNEAGKNKWEFGAGKKGAIILCNCDADNRTPGSTSPVIDNEDAVVNSANDVLDLAPLIVRQSGILPSGITLVLSVADRQKIRIFNQRSTSATAIIGSGAGVPAEVAISNTQSADVELGIEATQYPGQPPDAAFDGLIRLALILKDVTTEIAKDDVVLRVAPWIMPSHLNVTEELYVVNTGGNATFIGDIDAIAGGASVPFKKAAGASYLDPPPPGAPSDGPDPWMQDTMEVGYSLMPGKQMPVVLDAVRTRGLDPYAKNELLGPDYGFVRIVTAIPQNTFDSHGNLEVSPPVKVGSKDYKLGRIYHGRGKPAQKFNSDMKKFLNAQLVQKPFEVDTDWLAVGHVDEIISFVPSNVGTKKFKMLFASTDGAIQILKNLKNNGNGSLTLFTGKVNRPFQQRTVDQILIELNDKSTGKLGWANDICQSRLNNVENTMKTELGLDNSDIVKIPSIFFELPGFTDVFVAFMPGMVNMLVITRPNFANTRLVIPKPFGPVLGGVDQLEKDVLDKLTPLGYAASQIKFVDDFDTYHVADGEIHCGTNSKREPHKIPWWEQVDI